MRRFAAVAITSGALVAGLTAAASPASAKTADPLANATPVTEVKTATVTGAAAAAQNKANGGKVSAKACRTVWRIQGYKNTRTRKWIIYVKNTLFFCYTGRNVTSAKNDLRYYTYNKRHLVPKKWVHHSLTVNKPAWTVVQSYVQVRFYNTSNRRYYSPYVKIRGYANGGAYAWYGG